MSKELRATIERNAKACKPSISEYVRQVATMHNPRALPPEEFYQILDYLKVCKSNIEADQSWRFGKNELESVKIRLLALKAQQEENRKLCGNAYNKDWLDYVFVNEVGDIIRPSYIESVFPRILMKCGLEHRRFHDLRHTCATLMNQQKVPLKQVQVYLGHSDIQTTVDIQNPHTILNTSKQPEFV